MKIKLILLLLLFSAVSFAQYNFPFTSRYATLHLMVNTNLKKFFEADSKRLREAKVKLITAGNDSEPEFEKFEVNSRGLIENYITHSELYLMGEDETEYNIKYNIGGQISYIYHSPDQTAFFYEHDFGKYSGLKSESYDGIDYTCKYYYKDEMPDSLYTDLNYNGKRTSTRFKIETNADTRLIKKITDVTIPTPEVAFTVSADDKSMTIKAPDVKDDLSAFYMPPRADYDYQKYMKFTFEGDKIASYTTIKKIKETIYIYTTAFTYQPNGLIDTVTITKSSGGKQLYTKSFKYKYEYY